MLLGMYDKVLGRRKSDQRVSRLAEISNFTVGIIEAGDYRPDDDMINVPMGWNTGPTWGNPDYDWGEPAGCPISLAIVDMFYSRVLHETTEELGQSDDQHRPWQGSRWQLCAQLDGSVPRWRGRIRS